MLRWLRKEKGQMHAFKSFRTRKRSHCGSLHSALPCASAFRSGSAIANERRSSRSWRASDIERPWRSTSSSSAVRRASPTRNSLTVSSTAELSADDSSEPPGGQADPLRLPKVSIISQTEGLQRILAEYAYLLRYLLRPMPHSGCDLLSSSSSSLSKSASFTRAANAGLPRSRNCRQVSK